MARYNYYEGLNYEGRRGGWYRTRYNYYEGLLEVTSTKFNYTKLPR